MEEAAIREAEEIPEGEAAVTKKSALPMPPKWKPLTQLWAKPVAGPVPQIRWWKHEGRLYIQVNAPLPLADWITFKKIGFVEGLWQQDVAEFFIADRRTGRYQEFNLSPGGAWWSAIFTSPRVKLEPQPEWRAFGVRTKVVWSEKEWTGELSFPMPDLSQAAVNCTAITAGREGRRFYSLAALGSATPDFHRPEDWITF